MNQDKKEMISKGMKNFSKRIVEQEKLYHKLLDLAEQDKNSDNVFRITDKSLFYTVMKVFGSAIDNKKAKADLFDIYEAGIHKETGALIVSNKGATLYSLTPRTMTPCLIRHLGFCVYMPGLGIEFVNVGLVGDVYNKKTVLRTESACTPSFIFGSQRCNCEHQWHSIRELAADFNQFVTPAYTDGAEFESWVQKQFSYVDGKHVAKDGGQGFILMHVDTQNGMGSGYTQDEFAFDLFTRASIRHRGEYSSEQITKTTMWGGFEAIGINADPRQEADHAGYKVTFVVLDYLGVSKNLIFLTNNHFKMQQLNNNGYKITRVKSLGAVNPAGAQEAEQRGTEFGHADINGDSVSFEEEFERLKTEINELVRK